MSRTASRTCVVLLLVALIFIATGLIARGANAFQAYQTPPIKLGTSGGNVNDHTTMYCCSGTLGSLVSKGGIQYILSNNHVLARSDQAAANENISQPGMVDTSCGQQQNTIVASFSQAPKLGSSNVDAAIAQVKPGMVDSQGTILSVGVPANTMATPAINMGVAKAGRTTGFTCASIGATNLSVSIQYETQCNAGSTWIVSYTNQVLINSSRFSAGGDSGSLIVSSGTAQPVALLFAGSSNTTIGNPIQQVAQALGVSFVGGATHTVSCGGGKPRRAVSAVKLQQAKDAKERHADELMRDDAIMAVGVGSSDVDETEPVIVVVVEQGRTHREIPPFLDGVRTKVILTDKIRAYGWNEPMGSCKAR